MTEIRKRVLIPAEFETQTGGKPGYGKVKNVSLGGLFVDTAVIPYQGETVHLRMTPGGVPLDVTGMVWWTTRESKCRKNIQGFGMRVLEDDEKYRAFVEKQLAEKSAAEKRLSIEKKRMLAKQLLERKQLVEKRR